MTLSEVVKSHIIVSPEHRYEIYDIRCISPKPK